MRYTYIGRVSCDFKARRGIKNWLLGHDWVILNNTFDVLVAMQPSISVVLNHLNEPHDSMGWSMVSEKL
jgi:hypothetical protein